MRIPLRPTAFFLAAAAPFLPLRASPERQADVVIYGATPCGIVTAVRAGREGLNVILVSAYPHIGGIMSNGLGLFDTLYHDRRGPLFDEVRTRITGDPKKFGGYEPHVAEAVFEAMVAAEKSISLLRGYYPEKTIQKGRQVASVQFQAMDGDDRVSLSAPQFVDASYEGDLAAVAGARMTAGREARSQYGEAHAGLIFTKVVPIPKPSAYEREGLKLEEFPLATSLPMAGSTGEADDAVQAYNFRVCLTREPGNRLPVEKPARLDPDLYADMQNLFKKGRWHFTSNLPAGKTSWNAPILIAGNFAYPNGSWAVRRAIAQRHRDFALGYLWFLQNDPAVPLKVREQARAWGPPKDEFADNGGFPREMYVRESRRLVGRYVFTEKDAEEAPGLARAPLHGDSIAFTEWPLDAHSCHWDTTGDSDYEGKVLLSEETRPAQVPYRCLLPSEIDNLLVTGCVSSSHIGWGAIRLEPTWMLIGESAGYALALAHRAGVAPADIPVDALQRVLVRRGLSLSFFNDLPGSGPSPLPATAAAQYYATKGFFATYDAQLNAPLSPAVARIWAQPEADPTATARRVAQAAEAPGTITAADFAAIAGHPWANSPAGPLTRGEACRWLFSLNAPPSEK